MKMTQKTLFKFSLLVGTVFMLYSCTMPIVEPRHGSTLDHMQDTIQKGMEANEMIAEKSKSYHPPRLVQRSLTPENRHHVDAPMQPERHFNINVDNVPLEQFYMGLVQGTPYNMMVSPEVHGTISLHLKDVTVPEVMEKVREVYGFEYEADRNGYQVVPTRLSTWMFKLNYVDVQRSGSSSTNAGAFGGGGGGGVGFGGGGGGTNGNSGNGSASVSTSKDGDLWERVEDDVNQLIDGGGSESSNRSAQRDASIGSSTNTNSQPFVLVNPMAGIIMVRAYPKELRMVAHYLWTLQKRLDRQVVIEAKILEIELNDEFNLGIDWALLSKHLSVFQGNITSLAVAARARNSVSDSLELIANAGSDFHAVIDMMETQGNIQVLSSPHITTLNNQQALIKVGQNEFFSTGVGFAFGGFDANHLAQNLSLSSFFSGIALDVTPQISHTGEITLHIHPMISDVIERTKTFTVGTTDITQKIPTALSRVRETDNIVRVKNGQIVIIGGLMSNSMTEDLVSTPLVNRIPYLGAFFRDTKQKAKRTELVILIRPIVMNDELWTVKLGNELQDFAKVNRGFHLGTMYDTFGTEGEADFANSLHSHVRYEPMP